jgi:beta-N-acetylhexosaminidase
MTSHLMVPALDPDLPRGSRAADPPRLPDPFDPFEPADFVAAARAALVVEGTLPDLRGARIVSIASEANIAVGEGRWGVVADLVVAEGDAVPDGPVVVQVRDAHRRPGVAAMLAAVSGPAVVVEWGWPGPRTGWASSPHPRICTRGNSRPSITAVEELLEKAGWTR